MRITEILQDNTEASFNNLRTAVLYYEESLTSGSVDSELLKESVVYAAMQYITVVLILEEIEEKGETE